MNGETVMRDEITIMGRLQGPRGTKVQVGNVRAEVRPGGQADLFVAEDVSLKVGKNTITVTAKTPQGKRAEQSIEATYEPLPEPPLQELTVAAQTSNSGTTISVNSTDDAVDANPGDGECTTAAGTCTLRAAIQETNALGGQDTVQIPGGNYVLTIPGRDENHAATGDLDVTDVAGLVINGAGQDSTIVDAAKLDRVIDAQPYVSLQVQGVTITGGNTQWNQDFGSGGGIYVEYGDLTVADSTISTNSAEDDGGGIYVAGNLSINRSTFQSNNSGVHGGGAYADYGDLTVNYSTFINNKSNVDGGALGHDGNLFILKDSTVSGNTARYGGGGIVDHGFGDASFRIIDSVIEDDTSGSSGGGITSFAEKLFVSGTTVSGNKVTGNSRRGGGGIESWGDTFRIEHSTIQDNMGSVGVEGGGVVNWTRNAEFTIVDSIIRGNSTTDSVGGGISNWANILRVDGSDIDGNVIRGGVDPTTGYPYFGLGGGIYNLGPGAEITNTTLSGNIVVGGFGGGFANEGDASLRHVTLYGNRAPVGGNLENEGGIILENTLLTGSLDGGNCAIVGEYSSSHSEGHNLESGDSCGLDQPTDLTNTDPLLGPLQDNGGPTRTHALLPGSPAIDAGGDVCPPNDQRGVARMQDGNGNGISLCDIGAFELEGSSPPVPPAPGELKAMMSAPESLNVVDGALTPNPFTVSATVRYEGFDPIENANVSLTTSPEGLTVESGSSVSLGTMSPGEERQVSWQVRAPEQKTRRVYDLEMMASAPGVSTFTASRQITVPALTTRPDPPPGEGDDQGQPEDENASGCDPINFVTGNVYEYREDLYVPGRGIPVRFVRFYNSRDPYEEPLGAGWTHTYNVSLEENPDGSIEEMDPQGKRLVYNRNQDGSYTEQRGFHDRLSRNPDGTFFTIVRKESRDRWRFDADGVLTGISDRDGNTLAFSHNTLGELTGITDSAGRRITLEYDASGHLTTLTDPMGNTTRYSYEAGNLASVTDPLGNAIRYDYDAEHNLIKITDKTGGEFLFTYDEQDRAASARAGDGSWAATLDYDPANNKTTVTDSKGGKSVFHYNDMSRITRLEQPDGTALDYTFDPDGNRTSRTDGNAATAHAQYDENGNPVEVTTADGATTRTTYDEDNNRTSVTDALGNTTSYAYDARGNLVSEVDPLGNKTTYEYDDHGQLIKTTKPSGKTAPDGTPLEAITTYTYDAQGNRISETDALGNETTYSYDLMGRMTSMTDARGNVTRYTNDALGRVTKVTNPDGTNVLTTYDAAGNPVESTDETGRITRTTYDPRGNPTSVTDPAGNQTRYGYDTEGNLISETDALGNRTTYDYDALGRKINEIKPDGTKNPDGTPGTVTTSYSYDAAGNLVSKTDPRGRTTRMAYDRAGRLVKVTDPKGGVATYEYDLLGRRTRATNPNGHSTIYQYDAMGRLIKETDPLLNTTSYTYDAAGNQKSRIDAEGRRTNYTYDAANHLTLTTYPNGAEVRSTYDAVGNLTSISDETGPYSFAYDVRNRPVRETWPGNRIIRYEYDAAGNRTALVHPDGMKVLYTYDSAGRMASVTDREGARTTYAYDALGRTTRVSYPNAAGEEYAYDPLGRTTIATATGPGGAVLARQSYVYDDASNPVSITDQAGKKSTFAYDALDRLTSETSPGGQTTTYAYDAAGNRTSMTKGKTTTTYAHDAAERMTKAGANTYAYDNIGNLTSVKSGKKTVSTYAYDYEGMMTRADGITYARDPLGRIVSSTSGTTTTSYLFDGQQAIEEQTGSATPNYYARGLNQQLISRRSGASAPTYYHHDAIGSVTGLSGSAGILTDTYAYDAFGNVVDRTGRTNQPYQYLSDAYDASTKIYDFHARMYDPTVGRFLSEDPVDGLPTLTQTMNPYAYGVNNPLAHPDPGGMLISNFNDPLMSSGGDSPQNSRGNKEPGETRDDDEDNCPGITDIRQHLWGYEVYFDDCQVRRLLVMYAVLGGSAGGGAAVLSWEETKSVVPQLGRIATKALARALVVVPIVLSIDTARLSGVNRQRGLIYQQLYLTAVSPFGHRWKSQ